MSDIFGIGAAAQAVASVGVAVIQADSARKVSNKQFDIANKQLAIAVFVQDTWKNNHLPCELKLLSEVCAEPVYVAQYSLVTARASNDAAIAFSKQRTEIRRKLSIYSVGSFVALERQMGIAEALVSIDAVAAARRREDGRADLKKQQRIENQNRAVALGRNLLDQSGSAMRAAAAGYSTGGATVASAMNSGAQLLGYLAGRDNPSSGGGRSGGSRTRSPASVTGNAGVEVTGKFLGRGGADEGAVTFSNPPDALANLPDNTPNATGDY